MKTPRRSWRKQWRLCRLYGHCPVRWFYGDAILAYGGNSLCVTCGKVL